MLRERDAGVGIFHETGCHTAADDLIGEEPPCKRLTRVFRAEQGVDSGRVRVPDEIDVRQGQQVGMEKCFDGGHYVRGIVGFAG